MGTRTTATNNTSRAAGAVKISLQFIGALTKPPSHTPPRSCDLGAHSLHRLPEMLVLQRTVQPQQSRHDPAVRMAGSLFPFFNRTR